MPTLNALLAEQPVRVDAVRAWLVSNAHLPHSLRVHVWQLLLGLTPTQLSEAAARAVSQARALEYRVLRRTALSVSPPARHSECLLCAVMALLRRGRDDAHLAAPCRTEPLVAFYLAVCPRLADLLDNEEQLFWTAQALAALPLDNDGAVGLRVLHYLSREDARLAERLASGGLLAALPLDRWQRHLCTDLLSGGALAKVLDKVVAGCPGVLVMVMVAALLSCRLFFFRRRKADPGTLPLSAAASSRLCDMVAGCVDDLVRHLTSLDYDAAECIATRTLHLWKRYEHASYDQQTATPAAAPQQHKHGVGAAPTTAVHP